MTRDEFKILAKAMKSAYTDNNFLPDKESFDLWYALLKDIDYPMASRAVKCHIMTSPYVPKIADILKFVNQMTTPEAMNGAQAWDLAYKAICNSSYNSEEEFSKLPPLIQKSIGSAENLKAISLMPNDTVCSVQKSLFLRTYENEVKRAKELDALPLDVRELIENNQLGITTQQYKAMEDFSKNS